MKRHIILLLIISSLTGLISATPATPCRYVIANGECIFIMDPCKDDKKVGSAYQITDDGFKKLWQVKGWFAFKHELFLTYDARTLVRLRAAPSPKGDNKLSSESALFFYRNGKLIKKYELSALLDNVKSAQDQSFFPGGSGWSWTKESEIAQSDLLDIEIDRKDEAPDEDTFRSYNHYVFRLKTVENIELFFDLFDGRLIKKKIPVVKLQQENDDGDPFEQ